MYIEQIYTNCLAEAAYYIQHNGEAAVVDPLRDIEPYLERANRDQATIKYIFLTHFHADFMAGHQDLARETGAVIVVGPTVLKTGFDIQKAADNEVFNVGKLTLKTLHTPGHTPESICILLHDEKGKEYCVFTGDTLFIGDVGRPDLAQKVIAELTQEKLARMLFRSLRTKIMPLPDEVIVYPNHGAGSPCGKYMSAETYDTLGHQKKVNYGLRADQTEDEFIQELCDGLTEPPQYFPSMVLGNVLGVESIYDVRKHSHKSLSVKEFERLMLETKRILILDTRNTQEFVKGFIKNSVNVDLDNNFAIWVGTVLRDIKTPLLIVAAEGRERETADRLSRVGFDQVLGYLEGGFERWKHVENEIDQIPFVNAQDLMKRATTQEIQLMDVRKESEYASEHLVGAVNLPLDYWWNHVDKIDPNQTYYVYCGSGFRTGIFSSLMRRNGFTNLVLITDGFNVLKDTDFFKVTEYICPHTLL